MDELHKDIKKRVEACYRAIQEAEDELSNIRENQCLHPEQQKCDYMWSVGHLTSDTTICSVCGEVIIEPVKEGFI